jgi:hypothetical protein
MGQKLGCEVPRDQKEKKIMIKCIICIVKKGKENVP